MLPVAVEHVEPLNIKYNFKKTGKGIYLILRDKFEIH